MIRVRILRGTALGGIGNDATPGETREFTDANALALIAAGRAVRLPNDLPREEPELQHAPAAPAMKRKRNV
jgi:hypothetical protein